MAKSVLGKRPITAIMNIEEDRDRYRFDYRFKIMLPNNTSVSLTLSQSPEDEMHVLDFIELVKIEYKKLVRAKQVKGTRRIMWSNPNIYVEDTDDDRIKMRKSVVFKCLNRNKCNYLTLRDGVDDTADIVHCENMWDLTPDPDMLLELPQEYTFITALADLIDNSLQAVWSNDPKEQRLVSVTVDEGRLSIFDNGPGMDGSDTNSIVKWGKMGASLHRPAKYQAIGGKPPYLTPFFGMFGFGGPIASMHLGSLALVSSKTKDSKKVYTLHLDREALLKSQDKTWKADGGIRDPLEDEKLYESFTKVEIFGLKVKLQVSDNSRLQCRLKDIYFPYIQCDEMHGTGRTATPVQFKMNDGDLAELEGGEVAITNMLSCNGPDFVLQLRFLSNRGTSGVKPGSKAVLEAHARLKCVYFPIVEGKESIDTILERLRDEGLSIGKTFDTFPRASVRRLGRLLPDARWGRLPFMEPKQRKGDKAQVLKRCCMRVKCFIETDAGFNPNPYKTDLAHHDQFTVALKNFGNKPNEKEMDVSVDILRGGKSLSLSQLEKEYEEWILQMHVHDDEVVSGDIEDSAVVVFLTQQNQKALGISSDVVRVHTVIKKKGKKWESGQKIKILKGAGAGCHKNNLYATLEYIVLEGLSGDVCGEVRLICRPLDVPEGKGCLLKDDNGNMCFDIQSSKSFPISIIDSGKCHIMEVAELEKQLDKLQMKVPSRIDVLNAEDCQQLGIDGVLTFDASVYVENAIPKTIIAALRPACYVSSSSSKSLDQKSIIKDDLEMSMEITYLGEDDGPHEEKHIYAQRIKPSVYSGLHGLYMFSLRPKDMKAGTYKFLFTVTCEKSCPKSYEKTLIIMPETQIGQWKLLGDDKHPLHRVRVGSRLQPVSIACYDAHGDRIAFTSIPVVLMKLEFSKKVTGRIREVKVNLSADRMTLNASDICIENSYLDNIRPLYKVTLVMYSRDGKYSVHIPCQVIPGPPFDVKVECVGLEKNLLPGSVINMLILEIFDKYGNHVESGVEVSFEVDGLFFLDQKGSTREVDDDGFIDLSGLLKVIAAYGKIVSLSVNDGEANLFKKEFQVERRILKIASMVPEHCFVGSELEDIMFEVTDSNDTVDESIHHTEPGESHMLVITPEFPGPRDPLKYKFSYGKCTVPNIPIPQEEGVYSLLAAHSNHPELCTKIEFRAIRTPISPREHLLCHDDFSSPGSNRGMMLLNRSPVSLSQDMPTFVASVMDREQELDSDIRRTGMRIGEHEKKLELLSQKKKAIEQGICDLQVLLEPEALTPLEYYTNDKEGIERQIVSKGNTAASVISLISKISQSEELQIGWMPDIVGIVAMLGIVADSSLSRIFAKYLGEDNMLAVVCKSYETASALEHYKENGRVDPDCGFYQIASELGKPINSHFLVICLEEISPYTGKVETLDPQRRLDLPKPLLPTETVPHGFLDYAVNLINLDVECNNIRTTRGHGLRETLFYRLFGELQVYETRESMHKARSCIKHGAVSLDGGINKGNGVLSLGVGEPDIQFPVESSRVQSQFSPQTLNLLKDLTEKKQDLEATSVEIERVSKAHSEELKEFHQKTHEYQSFIEINRTVLAGAALSQSPKVKVKIEDFGLD